MILKEISRGIPHIEDLSVDEFLNLLETLSEYTATEKVDGSQILFGIDENGFYTSRETKGGDRVYTIEDYELSFPTTYMRSAHKLLESVLPLLKEAGLRPGDQVEAEVLYGGLPNVVPYSEDSNYLIFLRTTEGSVNIDRLKQKIDGRSLSVTLESPITEDAKTIKLVEKTNLWTFSRVPQIPVNLKKISESLRPKIQEINKYLNKNSGIKDIPNRIIESTPLNKRPEWCSVEEWKILKDDVKEKRDEIHSYLYETKFLEIKEHLLDLAVRPNASKFGPLLEEGGWIEGVVLRHNKTGKMVKLVDKNTFGVVREFAWQVRNSLTERARGVTGNYSFLGSLQVGLATALGHPELGTTQCKKYYKQMVVESISVDNIKDYMISLVEQKRVELEANLDKYEKEKSKFTLKGSPNKALEGISYTGSIDNRTRETFAALFEQIEILEENIRNSTTFDSLVKAIAGKYLGDT